MIVELPRNGKMEVVGYPVSLTEDDQQYLAQMKTCCLSKKRDLKGISLMGEVGVLPFVGLAKRQPSDGRGKSSRCKGRKS